MQQSGRAAERPAWAAAAERSHVVSAVSPQQSRAVLAAGRGRTGPGDMQRQVFAQSRHRAGTERARSGHCLRHHPERRERVRGGETRQGTRWARGGHAVGMRCARSQPPPTVPARLQSASEP